MSLTITIIIWKSLVYLQKVAFMEFFGRKPNLIISNNRYTPYS
jgi:hypothetical protein